MMERVGDVLERWLAGHRWMLVCRLCWLRHDPYDGVRCSGCGGVLIRMRIG